MLLLALAAGAISQLGDTLDRDGGVKSAVNATFADLEAALGYATNPLLETLRNNTGRAFGRVSFRGVHTRTTPRSSTIISAYGENTTYGGRYGSQQLAQISAHHSFAASETLRVFGDLNAAVDRGGQLATRLIFTPITLDPGASGPVLLDPTLDYVTLTGRTYRFNAHAGAQISSSERDTWNVGAGIGHTRRRGDIVETDETDFFGSVAYSRRMSERSTLGFQLAFQQAEFDGPEELRLVTPQITGSVALSQNTHVSGAVGASIASSDDGIERHTSTGLAGNLALCRSGEAEQLCASISRNQQIAAGTGALNSLAATLSYSRSFGRDQAVQLSATAARFSNRVNSLDDQFAIGRSTSLLASAAYSRRLSDRWSAGATVSGRRISQSGAGPRADVSASIFVRYRLGDLF